MRRDRSILEKIADTARDIVRIASDAADHALGPEQRPAVRPHDPVTFRHRAKNSRKSPPDSQPRRRHAGIRRRKIGKTPAAVQPLFFTDS